MRDYNVALTIYDALPDDEKISFKDYVFQTWPQLNPKIEQPDSAALNEMLATLKEVRSEANIWLDEMKPSVLRRIDLAIAQCEGKGNV